MRAQTSRDPKGKLKKKKNLDANFLEFTNKLKMGQIDQM